LSLDKVHLGHHAMLLTGEHDAAGAPFLVRLDQFFWRRQPVGLGIDRFVTDGPFDRVLIVGKHAFDMLVIEQSRAVDIFVDHPSWQQILFVLGDHDRSPAVAYASSV